MSPFMKANSVFFRFILFCCITIGPASDANSQCCYYKITMQDSYGDGWNGGYLEVKINGTTAGTFMASQFASVDSFQVCQGDLIEMFYTAGVYENENSYQFYDPFWNLLNQGGPSPITGLVYTSSGNCSSLPLLGSHPCLALPIDTGVCVVQNNSGFNGSGLAPNCANYQGGDIWFTMTVPPSGNLVFETDSGSLNDTGLAIWMDSVCTNPKLIACDDDAGNGYFSFITLFDLPPGQNLFIQVWGYGGGTGNFRLCVNDLGTVTLDSSELPIVVINTQGQSIVPDTKISAQMEIRYNGVGNITYLNDSANVYNGAIGIEIRGATSASYPQPAYGFETRDILGNNNNVSLLGMPPENDWVLLSNFNDRSLIRNTLAHKIFTEMGHYSVRSGLCEVIIDSSYKGIYVFGEKIKRDINRVNIAKLTPIDISGDSLTGGYILQQNYWDNNNSFQSNYSPIDHPGFDVHFVYEYPEPASLLPVQKNYIASFVDSLEDALYSPNYDDTLTGYRKYLDTKSFIDYFIVNELSRNADGFKKSVFFHKDKFSNGGKLNAGPVWDFDWAWKNLYGCYIYENFNGSQWAYLVNDCPTDNYSTGWYVRLLQDTLFQNELKCTYVDYRQTILDTTHLFAYIDSVRTLVNNAQSRHFRRFPILGMSGPAPELGAVANTYDAELDTLKAWISTRLDWLDLNMPGNCLPVFNGLAEVGPITGVKFFPNPSTNSTSLVLNSNTQADVTVHIYDNLGKLRYQKVLLAPAQGTNTFLIDLTGFAPGIYQAVIQCNDYNSSSKLILLR